MCPRNKKWNTHKIPPFYKRVSSHDSRIPDRIRLTRLPLHPRYPRTTHKNTLNLQTHTVSQQRSTCTEIMGKFGIRFGNFGIEPPTNKVCLFGPTSTNPPHARHTADSRKILNSLRYLPPHHFLELRRWWLKAAAEEMSTNELQVAISWKKEACVRM
jgi:hypothetical protein